MSNALSRFVLSVLMLMGMSDVLLQAQDPAWSTQAALSVSGISGAKIGLAFPVGQLIDVNGDGLTDVVATGEIGTSPAAFVWLQNADHTFSAPMSTTISVPSGDTETPVTALYATRVGDLDGDGLPEFVTTFTNGNICGTGSQPACNLWVAAYKNLGGGTFSQSPTGVVTVPSNLAHGKTGSMRIFDSNGDGKPDLVISGWTSQNTTTDWITTFIGNGSANISGLSSVQTSLPGEVDHSIESVGDFNNDGRLDLAVINPSSPGQNSYPSELLISNGNGTFSVGPELPSSMSCAAGNYTGSGETSCVGGTLNDSASNLSLFLLNSPASNANASLIDTVANDSFIAPEAGNAVTGPFLPVAITYGGSAASIAFGSQGVIYLMANNGAGEFSPPVQATTAIPGSGLCSQFGEVYCLVDIAQGGSALQGFLLFLDNTFTGSFGTGFVVAEGLSSPTTTTVASSDSSIYFHATVTFTATVSSISGTPTGTVIFFADGNSIGTATLSGGTASVTNNSLAIGTHSITATYGGSARFLSSTSNPIQQTITKIPTGVQFTLNPNPSTVTNTFNIQIQVTATDGSIPAGTVSVVADGSNTLGNPTLNGSGAASLGANSLAVGQHTIQVSYSGTSVYDNSSAEKTQTVNAIATNTTVTANPASSTYLSCVTFTATVKATQGTPTGSVSFSAKAGSNSPVSLGNSALNSSAVATISSCSLTPATYTVTASYGGAADFATSSGTTNETVTTLSVPTLPPSPPVGGGPIHPGSPITIPVGGFPTPPGGVSPTQPIEIFNGGTPIGTVPPSGGTITWTPPSTGSFPIGSCYPGDADYSNTCAPTTPINVTVTAPTTLLVSAVPNPATFGQSATVTATVSSSYGTPTGSITCSSDSGSFGTSSVGGSGAAAFNTGVMSVGVHTITCNYTPTGFFDPSSGTGSETVVKATPTVTVSVSPEPSYPGDYATLTAAVKGVPAATPTGTVTFLIDGRSVGSGALSGGTATLSAPFTSVGNHTVTAQYGGDGNYNPANGTYSHTVVKLPTTTIVSSTPNPGIGGQQAVTIQSVTTFPDLEPGTLNERQPLTGTVTFYDGGTALGTVAINSTTELAVLTVPSMTVGNHNLTASYSGDADYTNSASAAGAFSETLVPPISGLNVSGNDNAADVSANVTWSAQVLNPLKQPQPNGTVTWTANGAQLGTSQVAPDGTTSFTTQFPTPGFYSVVATYAGNQEPGSLTFSQSVLSTGTDGSAPFVMSAPSSVSMAADGSAQVSVGFKSAGVSTPLSLTCSGAPAGYSCSISPATLTLNSDGNTPSVSVSITRAQATQAQSKTISEIAFAGIGFGMIGLLTSHKRRKLFQLLVLLSAVITSGVVLNGCGNGTVNFCFASNSTCGGSAALGTAQVNSSGIATLLLRLGVGTYSIRAEYEGTSSSQTSASVPLTVTVAGNHNLLTSTTLSATGTTGAYTLSGTVAGFGNTPLSGSVSFLDSTLNDLLIGSATLSLPIRTFAFSSTTSAPRGSVFGSLAVSDFNDDGFSDVAIVNRNTNQVFVYISNGDGTFKLSSNGFATDVSPDGVAVGDFNGDGISDLAVVSEGSGDVSVLLGVGDGTFQAPIRNSSFRGPGMAIGDFNNDGCLDVATTDNGINSVLIDLGDCTGGLQTGQSFTTDIAPVGIVPADFNSDGNMDVAVVNQGGNDISVLLGNGDGTFKAQQIYSVGTAPSSLAVADFNSDGEADIAVANQSDNTVSVLLSNGDGTFKAQQIYSVGTAPSSLALADFNSDGKADIAVANQGSNNLSVLLSNGDGTFQTQEVFPVAAGAASLGFADVNGDALPDLVIGSPAHLCFMLGGQLATYSSSGLSVSGEAGSHQVFAQYPGDVSHASSNSSLATLTAPSNAASISLTTSSNPSTFGDALIITATFGSVNGVVPTGTVTFADNGVALGVAPISNSGVATISTSILTTGSHSLVATYSGDANFF